MNLRQSIFTAASAMLLIPGFAMAENLIVIETDNNALVYDVADNNRLYQRYLGKKLQNKADYSQIPNGPEAFITHGMEDYYEPAIHINHPDGNQSTLLTYKDHKT